MNTSSPRFWIVGGVLASVLLLALGWAFFISPRMQAVAETRDQAVQLEDQALTIQAQASKLQAQAQDLPAQIRALRQIQTKVPSTVDVPALLREIQRVARENDVVIDALSPGQITVFQTTATDSGSSSSSSSSGGGEASPEASAAPAPAPSTPTDLGQGKLPEGVGLSYVPVSIKATGEFNNLTRFTQQIETLQRAYLITGVDLTRGTATTTEEAGTEGKNPLALALQTRVFVSSDKLRNLPDEALQKVQAG